MDPERALRELGGAGRGEEVLAAGVGWPALRAATRGGIVLRPAYGTYAIPGTPQAIVAAASLRGQVSCVSACAWWGLRQISEPSAVHIAVPQTRSLQAGRVRALGLRGVHHTCSPDLAARVERVVTAVDHAAWCTTPLEQLVLLDSALEFGRIEPHQLSELVTGADARRAWLHANASRRSQSVSETVARAALSAAGLRPTEQVHHDGVGTVDLGVGRRYSIEIDGFEHHGTKSAFAEDRRRDRAMAAKRRWTLRYTYWDVVRDPRAFAMDVAEIVGVRIHARFNARMDWMMRRPPGALAAR